MIAKGVQAHISKASFQYLLLEKKHVEWAGANGDQKWDGLVMLLLILKKINPTTQVGISSLKDTIEQATLQKSSNNVVVMIDRMPQNLEDIKDRGSTHDDYLCHMFRALMTSTNMIFRDFIQREKDKWDTEGTITSDELSNLDRNKFNNVVATTEWSKSDPKDALIAALTTRVNNL